MTNDKDKQWIRCSGFKCPHLPNTCTASLQYQAQLAKPTQSDALREALERIGVGMMPPEIIEGKLTLRLVRVDIAQEQSK